MAGEWGPVEVAMAVVEEEAGDKGRGIQGPVRA